MLGELFGLGSSQAGRMIRDRGPMLHGISLLLDAQDICKRPSEMQRNRESAICDVALPLPLLRDLVWLKNG
jgi:hypothetical protein